MLSSSIIEMSLAMDSSLVVAILTLFHVTDCILSMAKVAAAVIASSKGLHADASVSGMRMPTRNECGSVGSGGGRVGPIWRMAEISSVSVIFSALPVE